MTKKVIYLDDVLDAIESCEHYPLFDTKKMSIGIVDFVGLVIKYLDIKEAIEQLPSAQPEQRWIPCSERLPEKEGWYITTVESKKTGKRRIENDLFAIEIALSHGHTPNKFCKDGYRQRTVAWCEFPDPWRGEEHETD